VSARATPERPHAHRRGAAEPIYLRMQVDSVLKSSDALIETLGV
jgi:hypothetical protein